MLTERQLVDETVTRVDVVAAVVVVVAVVAAAAAAAAVTEATVCDVN